MTTGDDMAVQSVNRALSYVAQAVPESRRFLIINERDEARFPLASDGPAVTRIVKENGVAGVLRMPVCISPGLAHVVDKHMRLDAAAVLTPDQWQKACSFTRMEAVRAHRRMVSFVDDGIRAFDAAYGPMADAVPA